MKVMKKFAYSLTRQERNILTTASEILQDIKENCAQDIAKILDENIGGDITTDIMVDPINGFDEMAEILTEISQNAEVDEINS